MDEVATLLEAQISSGLCTGAQVARISDGRTERWAAGVDGIRQAIDHDTLSAIYCASKPLLALTVHRLASTGTLQVEAKVGDILGEAVGMPDTIVSDLLNHSAGLHIEDGETLKLYGYRQKREIALAAQPASGWIPGRDAGYSEYIGWAVLAEMVETATGSPWPAVVAELVLAPAGVTDQVVPVFERSSYRAMAERLRINIDLRGRAVPLLNERGPTFACEANPGYGAFASATGLAEVLHTYLTDPNLKVEALTEPALRRGYRWDEVMHLRGDTQNGLLADLGSYGVLGASPDSLGHTGLMGLTTVLHEPERGETVAITYFGLIDGPTATQIRRPELLASLGFSA